MKKHLGLAFAALVLPVAANAGTALTSVTGASVWPNNDNQDHSLGWAFTTTGVGVAALGYNDFGFNSAHNVGLYDSGGTLLASVSVTGASTLSNGYRYANLASVLNLGAGTYYLVGTTLGINDGWIYQATSFTTDPAVTYAGSFFTSGTGGTLAFPGNPASERQYLLTNFSTTGFGGVVPEPMTWTLLILGMGAVGTAMRKSRRARASFAF